MGSDGYDFLRRFLEKCKEIHGDTLGLQVYLYWCMRAALSETEIVTHYGLREVVKFEQLTALVFAEAI